MPRISRTRSLLTFTSAALIVGGASLSSAAFAAPATPHVSNANVSAAIAASYPGVYENVERAKELNLRCKGPTEENEYWEGYCAGRRAGIAAAKRAARFCLPRGTPGLSPSTDYAYGYRKGWDWEYDKAYNRAYDVKICAIKYPKLLRNVTLN